MKDDRSTAPPTPSLGHLDQSSAAWRWSGRLFDLASMTVAAIRPRAAVQAAARLSPMVSRHVLSRYMGAARRVLEPLCGDDWPATVDELCRSAARNRVLTRLIKRFGHDSVAPLLLPESTNAVRQLCDRGTPAIIAVLHDGPIIAVHSILHLLDNPALILTMRPHHRGATPLEVVSIVPSQTDHLGATHFRAAALCRAKLKAGGIVFMPLDGTGTGLVDVALLGRRLAVPPGAAVLSIMTGAPIVPVFTRWTQEGRIRVTLAGSVEPPADGHSRDAEVMLLRHVWDIFDRALRDDPAQMNLSLFDYLLRAPIWE